MDIKDFKKGQDAYIVKMHKGCMYNGSPVKPTIEKTVVTAVGRKYATTGNGRKYQTCMDGYSLAERNTYGERTFLCPTMESAQMYIEHKDLQLQLYRMLQHGDRYTLEQLRKVKEILKENENRSLAEVGYGEIDSKNR